MVCNNNAGASQPHARHLSPPSHLRRARKSKSRNRVGSATLCHWPVQTSPHHRSTLQHHCSTAISRQILHTLDHSNPPNLAPYRANLTPPPCRNSSDRYLPPPTTLSKPTLLTHMPLQTRLAYSRAWHLVDAGADPRPLGRLASSIALTLMGKHKPIYDPSTDCGDYVVCTGLSQLHTTGKKMQKKKYYSHTTRPGSLKEITMERMMEKWGGGEILRRAVRGMLPKNRLRDDRMARLKCEFSSCDVGRGGHLIGTTFELTIWHHRFRGRRASLQAEHPPIER